MIKDFKAFFLLVSLISIPLGCSNDRAETKYTPDFQFDEINITRNDIEGNLSWKLDSPEARFNQEKRQIKAKRPIIKLYSDKKPAYDVTADSLTSFNNLEYIILEGDINLKQIDKANIIIKGDILRWDVDNGDIDIDRNPTVYTDNSSMKSDQITFDITKNQIHFKGYTKSLIIPKDSLNPMNEKLIINTKDIIWSVNTGDLVSKYEVWGERSSGNSVAKYTFSGQSLTANTRLQELNLNKCYFNQINSSTTYADKCNLNLYVNENNLPKLDINYDYTLENKRRSRERIEFISIDQRVNTRLNINKLNSALELID